MLTGSALDLTSGISGVFVNKQEFELPAPGLPAVGFMWSVPLDEGVNTIEIVAIDGSKNRAREVIQVLRKVPEFLDVSARYRVGLNPLQERGPEGGCGDEAYVAIMNALLRKPMRFHLMERDPQRMIEILNEHKIAAIADPGTAIRVGKLISAEAMLFGGTIERRESLTLDLRFVDTETKTVLYGTDVFGEGKSQKSIRSLAKQLVLKLRKEGFPLVQGKVTHKERKAIDIDVGADHGLRPGMKVLLYRYSGDEKARKPRLIRLKDGRPVEAHVAVLRPKQSSVTLNAGTDLVKVGDRVITK